MSRFARLPSILVGVRLSRTHMAFVDAIRAKLKPLPGQDKVTTADVLRATLRVAIRHMLTPAELAAIVKQMEEQP